MSIKKQENNLSFLIIQTAFLGDTILATAVIEKLALSFKKPVIDILIRKGNKEIFENNPHIRNIFIWDKQNKKYRQLFQLVNKIRGKRYNFCINLQRYWTTALITLLSGAEKKIGFSTNPLSIFFNQRYEHKLEPTKGITHEVDLYLKLLNSITSQSSRVMPRIYPSDKDYESVKIEIPYITIAPASVWFTKQYPEERWVEVINLINRKIRVCLIGSKEDKELCERIKTKTLHKEVINYAGQLSILQAAALMKNSLMNYVNDSAPLHIASAVDAPVTAIFCSTVPRFGFGPLSRESRIVEPLERLSCRPCGIHGRKRCPLTHFRCAEIPPEDIIEERFREIED
ncbi:MAG: glycosyltransferase family 9 protein [Chitinispirillaceae bacterium]|nr:glycosyltransferase family 9 protein [Chitinispirillaceae bacterium]